MVAQVEIVAGGGELGRATAMALAAGGRSVVAVDGTGTADLPSGIRREVAETTDPTMAGKLIDRRGRA